MAWKYRFDFIENEDGEFIAEVIRASDGPLLAAGPELRAAVEAARDFITSEYFSAHAEALEGHPISKEARPIYEQLGAALALCEGDPE